jgi:hypothetical protein
VATLEKALITNTVTQARIPVQFNPEEYSLSREVNYAQAAIPWLSAPLLQFAHGNMQTLEMELLIDTYEAHTGTAAGSDARVVVKQVTDLMNIEPTHAPPVLLFTWGSLSFTCAGPRVAVHHVPRRWRAGAGPRAGDVQRVPQRRSRDPRGETRNIHLHQGAMVLEGGALPMRVSPCDDATPGARSHPQRHRRSGAAHHRRRLLSAASVQIDTAGMQ